MKYKLQQFICLIISVFLIITSIPITSFADNVLGGNTNSGGGTNIGVDAAYAHKFMQYSDLQGYRISIVDKYGDRKTNSVDLMYVIPKDIESLKGTNSMAGGGASEIVQGYKDYINYIGWDDYSGTGLSKKKIYYSAGIKTEEFSQHTWNTNGVPSVVNSNGEIIETNMYPMENIKQYLWMQYNKKVDKLIEQGEENLQKLTEDQVDLLEIPLPSILNKSQTAFNPGGEQLIKLFKSAVGKIGVDSNNPYPEATGDDMNMLTLFVNMSIYTYNNEGEYEGNPDYLFRFTDPALQAKVGQLREDAIDESDTITTADIITENKFKVIIEPLYYSVPEILSTSPTMMARGYGGYHIGYIKGVCYGTVSYLQKYAYNVAQRDLGMTDEEAPYTWVGADWGTANLGVTTLMLSFNDDELGIKEPSQADVTPQLIEIGDDAPGYSLYSLASGDLYKTSGYSCHIYDNLLQTGLSYTHTYDSENYPAKNYSPGPAPDPTSLPNEDGEYIKQGKNKNITIIKYYCIDNGDGTYKYIENHTRESNPHTIEIENEGDFVVVDYFSSPTVQKPTSNTTSYDTTKTQVPMGTVQGDSPDDVVLTTTDNCLYVKLCRKRQVVKIYETDGVVDKIKTETPVIENNEYTVNTPDSGYNYQESLISPDVNVNPTTWEDVENLANGTPSEDLTLKIPDTTKVIYIRYTKDSSDNAVLVLHENEISHNFNLRDITGNLLKTSRHYKYISVPECGYFYDCGCSDDDDSCDCWSCNDDMDQESPGTYYFEVVNKPSYNKEFVYKWKESNTVYNGKGGGYQGFEVEASPYMEFTLSRAYADKPTIYPGLNSNNVKTVLNEMGIASESYKPAKTRYGNKSEQSKRVSWTNTFTTNWVYQNVDDPTIQWEHDNHDWDSDLQTSNDGSYEEIKNTSSRYDIGQIKTYSSYYKVWNGTSWKKFRKSTYGSKSKARAAAEEYSNELKAQLNVSSTGGIGNLNTGYSQPNNTKILGLWGKVNNGLTKPGTDNYKFDLGGMNFYTRKSVLNTNNKITFYPYYQMVIEHLNMSSTPVYFTSENLSTLLNIDRVDTSVFKSGNGNGLKLQSYQWSMHARIQNNMAEFGIMDRDSFLPAGAIYTLATGKEAGVPDVWVGFRVLSTYVADKSKLASNTGINNESEVNTKISNFKTQVEKSLTNYEIVMHGAEGLSVDETNFYGDSAQLTGKVGAYKLAGQKMDTDPKYDLKSGGDGANRSDIDILDTIEETHDFKLESDVNGNITVSMDGNKLEVIPKGKTSFSNDIVKDLDDRTKVVTNYINALDRNMGSDRNNKSWYNEAWSELHVKDVKFAYKLGFGDGEALRSAALNIKLNGRLENRDDMYNLDKDTIKEKARTFRFYTSAKSTLSEAASKPAGWVGDYAGQQVVVPGIHELFTSKLFYTSNTTVQDLN